MLRTEPAALAEDTAVTAPSPPSSPPALPRVRPEELVAALNAIESRRSATLAETVPLDEALRELHIDADPNEVLREIEARRRTEERQSTAEKGRAEADRARRRRNAALLGVGCVLATAVAVRAIVAQAGSYTPAATPAEMAQQRRAIAQGSTGFTGTTPPNVVVRGVPFFRMTPTSKPLGKIANGTSLYLDFGKLMELRNAVYGFGTMGGLSPSTQALPKAVADELIIETARPTAPQPGVYNGQQAAWEVVKLDGKLYVRAWTLKKLPPEMMRARPVEFMNMPPGDAALGYDKVMQPITIPLDAIGNSYSMSSSAVEARGSFTVAYLDKHAWEKFPYTPPAAPPAGTRPGYGGGVTGFSGGGFVPGGVTYTRGR